MHPPQPTSTPPPVGTVRDDALHAVEVYVDELAPDDETEIDHCEWRHWHVDDIKILEAPARRAFDLHLEQQPGLNVVVLAVFWENRGDAFYGVLLDVHAGAACRTVASVYPLSLCSSAQPPPR